MWEEKNVIRESIQRGCGFTRQTMVQFAKKSVPASKQ